MHLFKLLLSSLLFVKVCTGKEPIQHNLPEGVELVDPASLGLNSNIDLDKLLGNVKLLPISGNGLSKNNGLKTQILTVGFDGDENINLDDFELPQLSDTASEKPIAEAAFKSFKDFFKNPNKSMSFEEGTKIQLNKDLHEYGTKTGKILSGSHSATNSRDSGHNEKQIVSASQSTSQSSAQKPSGTLRRRIKKPKTTTTEQPKQNPSKTSVAIESPAANSFNQFDLPNYGLPAGQSPKVIELGHDQIEKLLASGKLTKSKGPGPQVIELGEEQLEDLLREHAKDSQDKTSSQSQSGQGQSFASTTVSPTVKSTQFVSTSRPSEEVSTSPRVQEVLKNAQSFSSPANNVIQQTYENKGVQVHVNGNNGFNQGQTYQQQNVNNNVVVSSGIRQGNLVGNQLVPIYQFGGQSQAPQRVVINNNPQIQHGFHPILQPSNLIAPVNQGNNNFINDPRFVIQQQQQQQFLQQQQQQIANQQQQQQQQQIANQQQQQQQQLQQQQIASQQQQQQNRQQQQQPNNQQKQQSSFEVISAPPVSFSSSSEPIKGNGNNNFQVQQQQQPRQVVNSNVNYQPQQQVFLNLQNSNVNQFQQSSIQNNVRVQSQPQSQPPQVVNSFNANTNTVQNRPTNTNTVQNRPTNTNTNKDANRYNNQSVQKVNSGSTTVNSNNIGFNIVRPPLQSQRLITPSPYIIHQVLNQIPASFNPSLTAKHVVNSPVLDPSVTFRQDPLPQQQQFSPNGNRQQSGQIHFPGNHNQRLRPRDQAVANSNHQDALRFGQNFNLQYQGPARQSQIIGQFSSPFYNHRNLAGI